jgi:hypothetical protein
MWLSEDTIEAIEKPWSTKEQLGQAKTRAQKPRLGQTYANLQKDVKRKARNDRRNHIENLAQQAEEAMGKQDIKTVCNITRQLSGEKPTH